MSTPTKAPHTLAALFAAPKAGQAYVVQGWIRSKRQSAKVLFIVLYDGTTAQNLQAVGDPAVYTSALLAKLGVGASVRLSGRLRATPEAAQPYELALEDLVLLGEADAQSYPLQPKAHSYPFLRSIAHLRPRTTTFGAVFRLRHTVSMAIHRFFAEKGFFYIHTPILAAADAEGAGEMFSLRTTSETDTKAFFGKEAHLSVSGQLEAELLAMGLGRVYTFGPTFRAEDSNTKRHLSEFWMIEPEAAFYDLDLCMKLAEDMLHEVLKEVLRVSAADIDLLEKQRQRLEKERPQAQRHPPLCKQLEALAEKKVHRISYDEAFERLKRSKANKKGKFNFPITTWGQDLQAEHEQALVAELGGAVIVYNYPCQSKAFYMRLSDDKRTVAAMDLLVPDLGELIGGSQREERLEVLEERMKSLGIEAEKLNWYLDTRRFGSVPHSGFGLGLERLMQLITGMENIRDVIPFPRAPHQLEF